MSEFVINVCPKCREQVTHDEYSGDHEHDGIYYESLEVRLSWGDLGGIAVLADRKAAEIEAEAREQQEARDRDRAELERMEAEWRESAPAEQIEALDASREQSKQFARTMHAATRSIMGDSSPLLTMLDEQRRFENSESAEDRAARLERQRIENLRRAEERVERFRREGPATIPFRQLRDAQQVIAADGRSTTAFGGYSVIVEPGSSLPE